jgi:hypothetical protein
MKEQCPLSQESTHLPTQLIYRWRASMKIPRRRQDAYVAGMTDFMRRVVQVLAPIVVERFG